MPRALALLCLLLLPAGCRRQEGTGPRIDRPASDEKKKKPAARSSSAERPLDPATAKRWQAADRVEVARSRRAFRGAGIAERGGKLAIVWAQEGGVFVRVERGRRARLAKRGADAFVVPTPEGFLGGWIQSGQGERPRYFVRSISLDGVKLGPPRAYHESAGVPMRTKLLVTAERLYLFFGFAYKGVTLLALPLRGGKPAKVISPHRANARGMLSSAIGLGRSARGLEALWRAGVTTPGAGGVYWTRFSGAAPSQTRGADRWSSRKHHLGDAVWAGDRWFVSYISARLEGTGRVYPAWLAWSERGQLSTRRFRGVSLFKGRGLWRHGQLFWLQARGKGARRRIELLRVSTDGRISAPSIIDTTTGASVVAFTSFDTTAIGPISERRPTRRPPALLAVWQQIEGREHVLGAARLGPVYSSMPSAR